jgi:hypothetical protein
MNDARPYLPRCLAAAAVCLSAACGDGGQPLLHANARPGLNTGGHLFTDVTETHLPATPGSSMDAQAFDADGDGDLDLLVVKEFQRNVLLLNDGAGRMTVAPAGTIPGTAYDSEDVAVADFDRDGDLDAVVAAEDDQNSEFYLNTGTGTFTDASVRLPARGTAQSVAAADLDGDGDADLVFGNHGQNFVFINGGGHFSNQTHVRLPAVADLTQDVEVGDVDGDGDPDLVFGNVDGNRLLLNDGRGFFTEAPGRIPLRTAIEETREADLGDVDGDGDLDLYFANVAFVAGADPQDRLLINDGRGFFSDATAARIGRETAHTPDADFVDVDRDGDLDLVTASFRDTRAWRVSLNDGTGFFKEVTGSVLPSGLDGEGIDVEAADFNGDGLVDLYLSSYVGRDRLVLGRE